MEHDGLALFHALATTSIEYVSIYRSFAFIAADIYLYIYIYINVLAISAMLSFPLSELLSSWVLTGAYVLS